MYEENPDALVTEWHTAATMIEEEQACGDDDHTPYEHARRPVIFQKYPSSADLDGHVVMTGEEEGQTQLSTHLAERVLTLYANHKKALSEPLSAAAAKYRTRPSREAQVCFRRRGGGQVSRLPHRPRPRGAKEGCHLKRIKSWATANSHTRRKGLCETIQWIEISARPSGHRDIRSTSGAWFLRTAWFLF